MVGGMIGTTNYVKIDSDTMDLKSNLTSQNWFGR